MNNIDEQARSYYAACWDAIHGHNLSVYYDPDDSTFDAAASGFRGWECVEITSNIDPADFGPGCEVMDKEAFVKMCIEACDFQQVLELLKNDA